MTLTQLDFYFDSFLRRQDFCGDISKNGVQVQNLSPDTKQITKVAFAVDASLDAIQQAKKEGAGLLFVHHGLFWGGCDTITGVHYKRIKELLQNDIALYACHIPLDANKTVGNNYGLARMLDLQNKTPFGVWRGMTLGVMGNLKTDLSLSEITPLLLKQNQRPFCVLPFGKEKNHTIGIISGGTGEDVGQAVQVGLDLYICGDFPHEQYNFAKESKINVLALGHYNSETIGVALVMQKLQKDLRLEAVFIDGATGL